MPIQKLVKEEIHPSFTKNKYLFRKKVFKVFGEAFHIYGPDNELAFYSKQKAFKIREDFRIFADVECEEELINITTPQIMDFGATYFVDDSISGKTIGAIRRKGMRSMIRDEWTLLSKDKSEIGKLSEASLGGALISRFLSFVPQKYYVCDRDGLKVADIKQHFNPFVLKYTMDIINKSSLIDSRLLIAVGVLLAGVEGRQDKNSHRNRF